MTGIHKIRLGFANAYLIERGENCILIDAGHRGREKEFSHYLRKRQIEPNQIKLIVITHVHFDHVGSLQEIKGLCKCPVAIHQKEASLLKDGLLSLPPGTNFLGKALTLLGQKLPTGVLAFKPVEPDILCSREVPLDDFGVPGKIIPTPGHTEGSLSVLLASGEAFVGDLAANYLPFGLGPIFPPFAENSDELLRSWKRLLDESATRIYPAHGSPFGSELLRQRIHLL